MIVLPGVRRSGANAAAVSARGRTAPTIGLQASVPHPLGEVREPGAVGFDHEEDGAPVLGLHRGWRGDGHEGAAGAHERGRPLEDVAADDVEDHVDLADAVQRLGVQVQERLRTEAERDVAVGGPSGADHPGAHLPGELDGDRSDAAGGAVDQHGSGRW